MSDISSGAATGVAGTKMLWLAVGVLGAAVVGLGGALYYQQSRPAAESPAPTAVPATPAVRTPAPQGAADKSHAPAAPKAAVKVAPAPAAVTAQPQAPAARPVCADCATVAAVTPVEREGQGSGAGAVAGGVLGAIVGNQIGRGQGKDVATIIGAVGGGLAGNEVEKKMKKTTVYQVELRMDDGSRRTLELGTPIGVGARVRVAGPNLVPLID